MQPDYTSFKPMDFVLDDMFIRHALSPDAESEAFWNHWLSVNPHKKADFEEALRLIEAVRTGLTDYARIHLSEEKEKLLLQRIKQTNSAVREEPVKIISFPQRMKVWKVAVAILLLSGIGGWFFNQSLVQSRLTYLSEISSLSGQLIEKINKSVMPIQLYLPDSTAVTLFSDSRLTYAKDFGLAGQRKVVLAGKAKFSVTRNPDSPFTVVSNAITTKVLGTVFEVNAFETEKEVTVKVMTGKVSVFKNRVAPNTTRSDSEIEGVLLASNQQVTYSKAADKFDKKLVSNPEVLHSDEAYSFVYEETPVTDVLNDLGRSYGITIVYDAQTLKGCQLTASLADESLMEKLQIICNPIGVQYEFVEGSIVITGKGCSKP